MVGVGHLDNTGTISAGTVEFVLSLLEGYQEVQELEQSLRTSIGIPRGRLVKAILAAPVLLALDDRPLILKSVTELLYFQLNDIDKEWLG